MVHDVNNPLATNTAGGEIPASSKTFWQLSSKYVQGCQSTDTTFNCDLHTYLHSRFLHSLFPLFLFYETLKRSSPLSAHTHLLPPSYSLPSILSIESCTMMDRDIVEPTTSTKEESKRGSIQYTGSRSWPNPYPRTVP